MTYNWRVQPIQSCVASIPLSIQSSHVLLLSTRVHLVDLYSELLVGLLHTAENLFHLRRSRRVQLKDCQGKKKKVNCSEFQLDEMDLLGFYRPLGFSRLLGPTKVPQCCCTVILLA